MMVEYRTWTSIAHMPFCEEQIWAPVIERLEREHAELGPIACWDDETTIVVLLASDAPDKATAANLAMSVVGDALHACHLSDRFPSVFRVEPASAAIAA